MTMTTGDDEDDGDGATGDEVDDYQRRRRRYGRRRYLLTKNRVYILDRVFINRALIAPTAPFTTAN